MTRQVACSLKPGLIFHECKNTFQFRLVYAWWPHAEISCDFTVTENTNNIDMQKGFVEYECGHSGSIVKK